MTPEYATPTAEDLNPFLQVTGLRLGKVGGKRVRGAVEPGEHQPAPWSLAHDGVSTTAIKTASVGVGHSGRPVVLFDFDGVLVRGDSYAHLVRQELQRSWWRRLAMLPVLAVAMPMLKAAALRRWGQRLVVRLAFVGWSTARFHARAAQFGRRLARDHQVVVGDAVAAARRHLASGARVVVVTTSAEPLARALLDELGLSQVGLVASQPTCGWLGLRAPLRNHGAAKVRRLAAHGLHPLWEIAYSDSLSDLPMLRGAVRPVLVNPDARLLARARRELGQRISSVEWR
jgi:phosphatidylglycerophosphatase C